MLDDERAGRDRGSGQEAVADAIESAESFERPDPEGSLPTFTGDALTVTATAEYFESIRDDHGDDALLE